MTPIAKRAAIYSRVSTAEQAEDDKTSLSEQERICREHCQQKGYSVYATFQDIGSGMTRKRPNFQQMLKDARQQLFDVIIAWKTDRLARGIYPCSALMEALEETGVTIETVAEPFDRTTFEIRAVLGRIEVENIVQRTSMGREARMRAGHNHVIAPYGYDYDLQTHRWVINEHEAKWVRQMFDWYVSGMSSVKIAYRLNADGVPTKQHSNLGWGERTVSDMVNQEYYAGRCYRNIGSHGRKPHPVEKRIQTTVPPIITADVWEAAKVRRSHNKVVSPRNNKRTYITQHVLVCEECGTAFRVNDGWGVAPRLECQRMIRYPLLKPCRLPKTINYDKVANQLWHGIVQVVGSEEGLEAAVQTNVNRVKGQRESIERRLKELTNKRSNLETEKDRVISWARKQIISEQELERQLKSLSSEIEECSSEQNRLLADLNLIGNSSEVYRYAKEFIPVMKTRINGPLSEEDKQQIVDSLVHRALLDGAGDMFIEFKVPPPQTCFGSVSS